MEKSTVRHNPYDWQTPVGDANIFAGRKEELTSIMDEVSRLAGAKPSMPTVAILGERKVGKTSLLLRVAEICRRKEILPILISMEKGFASDTWEFWNEVLSHAMITATATGISIPNVQESREFGFGPRFVEQNAEPNTGVGNLWFIQAYQIHLATPQATRVPTYIIENDLKVLAQSVLEAGYKGILLMIDEAHLLVGAQEVKEQIRHSVEKARGIGLVFCGESGVGEMFTNPAEPFYAHGRVLSLKNFTNLNEVAECALSPLSPEEVELMSPTTVSYLSRLSQGKPNQIRLICESIYGRYELKQQKDLNITIDVLDDVLESISHEDIELKRRVDAIRKLSSVDLEIIYNLTRYSDWSLESIVGLDESFRGEHKSERAIERRRRNLSEKRDYFIKIGLMSGESEKCLIAGGEFVSLYLRFFYEIQKYGHLSRKLVLGKGPETPFSEKCDKLMTSMFYALGQSPELRNVIFHNYQRDYGDIVATVKRRFSLLSDLRVGKHPDVKDLPNVLNECIAVCELIGKPGMYHLLCLSIRNLENPRELMQIELYFDAEKPIIVDLVSLLNLLSVQAETARILVEGSGDMNVELPDLAGLLKDLSGAAISEVMGRLPLVERWRFGSVQHELHGRLEKANSKKTDADPDEEQPGEWVSLYGGGDAHGAEESINKELESTEDRVKQARLYNDRGYIRASDKLKAFTLARKDLDTAISLHFVTLPLSLLNLSCLDLDDEDYDASVERIEDSLLLSLSNTEVEATYLRYRLPENHLGFQTKWEMHPANILEVSYINLGLAMLKGTGFVKALDILEEGLELMPNSVRLKHALARLYLHKKKGALSNPIYKELSKISGLPEGIKMEIKRLGSPVISGREKRGRK